MNRAFVRSFKERGRLGLSRVQHGIAAMGMDNRPPTAAELAKMKALVEKGMKEGAWGLSTGLMYTPGSYARAEEIVELALPVIRGDTRAAETYRVDAGQQPELVCPPRPVVLGHGGGISQR